MGWFSRKEEWKDEYDRRIKDPKYKKDRMTNVFSIFYPSETRVADDEGTMRRRNGEGCCGCGRWSEGKGKNAYKRFPQWSHHDDSDHHKDDHTPLF